MGFLSDKYKEYFETSSSKFFGEQNKTEIDSVLSAVLNNSSIPGNIQAPLLSGLGIKQKRIFKYGKETYSLGLPEISFWENAARFSLSGDIQEIPLDDVPTEDGGSKQLELFPVAPIKRDGTYIGDDKEDPLYKDIRTLLRKGSINYNDLTEMVSLNPSDEQIDDSYFLFSMDIYTRVPESIGMLFEFFSYMKPKCPVWEAKFEKSLTDDTGYGPLRNKLHIHQGDLDIDVTWDYINIEEGGAWPADNKDEYYSEFIDPESIEDFEVDQGDGGTGSNNYRVYRGAYVLHHKNEDGSKTSVKVYGIIVEHTVYAFNKVSRPIVRTMSTEFIDLEPDDPVAGTSGMHVPISPDFMWIFLLKERHRIMNDAAMIVLNAATRVELEWYQQAWVKIIIVAVAMYAAGLAVGKIVAGMASGITIGKIAILLAKILAANFLMEMIVSEVDGVLGVILAAAVGAAILGNAGGLDFGSMMTADNIILATNSLSKAWEMQTSNDMEELSKDYEAFMEQAEEKMDELQALQEGMDVTAPEIKAAVLNASLADSTMYARNFMTMTTMDPMQTVIQSVKSVEDYFDIMLTLPEYQEVSVTI